MWSLQEASEEFITEKELKEQITFLQKEPNIF